MSEEKQKLEKITHIDIAQLAANISKWNDTYEEFVWLLAEMELRIHLGREPKKDEIRPFAEKIAQQNPSLQDLHWFLAEKTIQYKRALGKKT